MPPNHLITHRERRLRGGVAWVALVIALALAAPASAPAAEATIAATKADGFGRLVLDFDTMPKVRTALGGTVLVLTFDKPVNLAAELLAEKLGEYVAAARRDPDGKALRIALTRPVRVNTMEAGDKLFVDLLPEGWSGMPPPLPSEVLAALNDKARGIERSKPKPPPGPQLKPLRLSASSQGGNRRLVLTLGDALPIGFERVGDRATVTISGDPPFDLATARAGLPAALRNISVSRAGGKLALTIIVPASQDVNGFREDLNFVVDIGRPGRKPGKAIEAAQTEASAPALVVPAPTPEAQAQAGKPSSNPMALLPHFAAKTAIPRAKGLRDPAQPAAAAGEKPASAEKPAEPAAAAQKAPASTDELSGMTLRPAVAPVKSAPVVIVQAEAKSTKTSAPATVQAPSLPVEAPPASPVASPPQQYAPGSAVVRRVGDSVQLVFPFSAPVPAAVVGRGKRLIAVFDAAEPLDLANLVRDSGGLVLDASAEPSGSGKLVRLTIAAPKLVTAAPDGNAWIVSLGEPVAGPSEPLALEPAAAADGRGTVRVAGSGFGPVHWISDPVIGTRVALVTAAAPVRALPRVQEFVELRGLATVQGIAVQPIAEDLTVTVGPDGVTIGRQSGLLLSAGTTTPTSDQPAADLYIDAAAWTLERSRVFRVREDELASAAAASPPAERVARRLALAQFYLANELWAEARAVLDSIRTEETDARSAPRVDLFRGAALIGLRRDEEALKQLDRPALAGSPEAALFRGLADFRLGRPARAREEMELGEAALGGLPKNLQILFRLNAAEMAIAAKDSPTAALHLAALDRLQPSSGRLVLLRGRAAEMLGRDKDALELFSAAEQDRDEAVTAEANLRAIRVRLARGETNRGDAIRALQTLTLNWRGDAIEAAGLADLARLQAAEERWRDAFSTLRSAMKAFPDAETTRATYDALAEKFTALFLEGGAEKLPTLEALALFYDFKEMIPVGRRGDEMIRVLADRLVEVDLLEQAAALLEYQVENRLSGTAAAQVASRAALVHLTNGKPEPALRILQATRQSGLPDDVLRARRLLEARALAEIGRAGLAVELVEGLEGAEVERLRADAWWKARDWQAAGETLERMLGDSWQSTEPLSDSARADALRAAIALSLAGDGLGVDRLRAKFAQKLAGTPDARSFEVLTAPVETRGNAYSEIAKMIAAADTLQGFLADYRARYGAAKAIPPG